MVFGGKNYSIRLSVYTVLISLVTIAYQPLHHTWHTWSIWIVFQSCLQNRISKIYRHFLVIFILLSKFSNGALRLVNFRQLENQSNSDYDGSRRKLLNDQLYCECIPPTPNSFILPIWFVVPLVPLFIFCPVGETPAGQKMRSGFIRRLIPRSFQFMLFHYCCLSI